MDGKERLSRRTIWLVPLGVASHGDTNGQPAGEPIELGATMVRGWGEDSGLDGGLRGEQAWAEGSTSQGVGGWGLGGVYETTFVLDIDEDTQDQLISAMTGWSLEQTKDWRRWATELRWLEGVLGNEWVLT